LLRKSRREAGHVLVVHSTVPYPMLKEPDTPGCSRTRRRAGDLSIRGGLDAITLPRRSRRADAPDAGIRSLSFHAPSRMCARRPRRGGATVRPCAASKPRSPSPRSSARRDRSPRRVFRLVLRLPAGKVVRPCPALLRGTRRSAGEGGNRPVRGKRLRRDPDTCSLREAVGSPRLILLRPGARDPLLRLPVQKWAEAFGEDSGRCTCTTTGTSVMITFRQARGDQFPGGAAGGSGRGGRPIPDVEPHRREHFHRSVAGFARSSRRSERRRRSRALTRSGEEVERLFSVSKERTYFSNPYPEKVTVDPAHLAESHAAFLLHSTFSTTPIRTKSLSVDQRVPGSSAGSGAAVVEPRADDLLDLLTQQAVQDRHAHTRCPPPRGPDLFTEHQPPRGTGSPSLPDGSGSLDSPPRCFTMGRRLRPPVIDLTSSTTPDQLQSHPVLLRFLGVFSRTEPLASS